MQKHQWVRGLPSQDTSSRETRTPLGVSSGAGRIAGERRVDDGDGRADRGHIRSVEEAQVVETPRTSGREKRKRGRRRGRGEG